MDGGRAIVQTAVDAFGRIDVLVNNAGISRRERLLDMSERSWDDVLGTHLKGTFSCSQAACAHMVPQRYGRIVNISSHSALGYPPHKDADTRGPVNYGAAKAGILGFTWTLARAMFEEGITCNAIFPMADTRLLLASRARRAADEGAATPGVPTVQRDAFDVSPLIAYLASEAAGYITGRTFRVDRGTIYLYQDPTPIRQLSKAGRWAVDELDAVMPEFLADNAYDPLPRLLAAAREATPTPTARS
jgi:3-oxoacyl-[acyl-carrier protein] reductase